MSLLVQNILLFQIGWFVCVLGGASEYSFVALPTVLAIILIHLVRATNAAREVYLILLTTADRNNMGQCTDPGRAI